MRTAVAGFMTRPRVDNGEGQTPSRDSAIAANVDWQILLLVLLVLFSSVLQLHNLGQVDLTLWDEVVHANVIKHLAEDCCTPRLLTATPGTDFDNWTNSTVWLHKPLLPFYISALSYKALGQTVLAMRLPALLFFQLLVTLTYVIGRRYMQGWVGLGAAALVAFNPFSFELVQGRQFSGFPDILFALCMLAAVALILEILRRPAQSLFFCFGTVTALAYFCKDALAIAPFGVLLVLLVWRQRGIPSLYKISLATVTFLIPVVGISLYVAHRFPLEYGYSQRLQFAHLWTSVEGWGRPWDYYLTVYLPGTVWPAMIGPLVIVWFWYSLLYGLINFRRDPSWLVLILFIAAFVVPLSFGVTKVPNFVNPVLPASFLLVAAIWLDLWEQRRFVVLAALSLSSILICSVLELNLWHLKEQVNLEATFLERSLLTSGALVLFVVGLFCVSFIPSRLRTPRLVGLLGGLALGTTLGFNIRWDLHASDTPRPASAIQAEIRSTAKMLPQFAASNSFVLLQRSEDLPFIHLFFGFWSQMPAQEVNDRRPLSYWLNEIPQSQPVVFVSKTRLSDRPSVATVPLGFVYHLR
jgi:4-amino-4-deoxy-L-arabinose transferase-like glycosyltransferase